MFMACILYVNCYTCIINLFCMTDCISLRRGTSKLLELVPNPFDLLIKLCSIQAKHVDDLCVSSTEFLLASVECPWHPK